MHESQVSGSDAASREATRSTERPTVYVDEEAAREIRRLRLVRATYLPRVEIP